MNPPVEQPVDLEWIEVAPGIKRLVYKDAVAKFDTTAPLGTPRNPRRCSVSPPPFKRHYSHVHGRKLTSWSEYRLANKELGIIDVGTKPDRPHCEPIPDAPSGRIVGDDVPRRRMITGR